MAGRFAPLVVIVSGAVFLLLGLSIWLAGLALRKGFFAIAGLLGGCIVGLYIVGRNLFSASLTGALTMLSALILEKLLIILLSAALAAAIAFAIVAEPYFQQEEAAEVQQVQNIMPEQEQTTIVEFDDIMYELKKLGFDAFEKIQLAGTKIPIHVLSMVVVPAMVFFVCGVAFWRYTAALFFSVTGTMAIFFGAFLTLIYKGVEPVAYVRGKPIIFAVVFFVMAVMGMTVQLLICKKSKKQKITKIKPGRKKPDKNSEPEKIVEHDWRSA